MKSATYSLLALRPDPERIDVLCVGAVVHDADGAWHISMLPAPAKLAAIAQGVQAGRLSQIGASLLSVAGDCDSLAQLRATMSAMGGAVSLHEFEGHFGYGSEAELQAQISAIMSESVLPPSAEVAAVDRPRRARPLTRTTLRRQFDAMGILGKHTDEIADHKVIPNYPVSTRHGLSAEFALQNSVMHITETVDFDVSQEGVRGKVYEAQAKCLIMRAAMDSFGQSTRCHVVISGGSANHASRSIDLLSTAAGVFAVESAEDMRAYWSIMSEASGIPALPM